MLRISNFLKIVPKKHCNVPMLNRTLTSYDIRNHFLDYFIKRNGHSLFRRNSTNFFDKSPVAFCHSSAAFVNADKNRLQTGFDAKKSAHIGPVDFERYDTCDGKPIYLSSSVVISHYTSIVQMLRNWSFSDYFKKGMHGITLNMFNGPYRSNSSRLYGTYFTDGNEPLKDFIDIEMKNVLENCPRETHPFIVHFLTCATLLESIQLQKATRLCTDRPIIVLSSTNNQIKARCCVPPTFVTDKFSASLWLATVANAFESEICPSSEGLNTDEVCQMKPKKLTSVIFDENLETAMLEANNFAIVNMCSM